MNNKNRIWIITILFCTLLLLCVVLLLSIIPEGEDIFRGAIFQDGWFEVVAFIITVFSFLFTMVEFVFRPMLEKVTERKKKTSYPGIDKLNALLEYSEKRREIEQEIYRLTKELSQSDVSEYLDINRLVFSGQSNIIGNGAINYEQFLGQFGIDKESVQIKKGYAVFLTPFNKASLRLFNACSSILNGMGILLQRTDTVVEKNDIMMNIVSQIVRAEFLIVNIDGRNPNVYYELGIAHAIGKPTILISQTEHPDESIGFDIRQKQIILYRDDSELERELLYQINRLRNKQIN